MALVIDSHTPHYYPQFNYHSLHYSGMLLHCTVCTVYIYIRIQDINLLQIIEESTQTPQCLTSALSATPRTHKNHTKLKFLRTLGHTYLFRVLSGKKFLREKHGRNVGH